MGRVKGATNKKKPATSFVLTEEKRITLVASIILEIIIEEQAKG